MDLLSEAVDSPVSHDRLFYDARSMFLKLWGAEYPETEVWDDIENFRPLYFFHLCQKSKLNFLNLTTASRFEGTDKRGYEDLWKRLEDLGEVRTLSEQGRSHLTNLGICGSSHSCHHSTKYGWTPRNLDGVSRGTRVLFPSNTVFLPRMS